MEKAMMILHNIWLVKNYDRRSEKHCDNGVAKMKKTEENVFCEDTFFFSSAEISSV